MQGNIARAYEALWTEHERIRALCAKILAQGDRRMERRFLRANPDDPKHHDEVLSREDRLPRPELRRVLQLNAYGRKIETILASLMKLARRVPKAAIRRWSPDVGTIGACASTDSLRMRISPAYFCL